MKLLNKSSPYLTLNQSVAFVTLCIKKSAVHFESRQTTSLFLDVFVLKCFSPTKSVTNNCEKILSLWQVARGVSSRPRDSSETFQTLTANSLSIALSYHIRLELGCTTQNNKLLIDCNVYKYWKHGIVFLYCQCFELHMGAKAENNIQKERSHKLTRVTEGNGKTINFSCF